MIEIKLEETAWMGESRCAGLPMELFSWSETHNREANLKNMGEGVRHCEFCPVRSKCLDTSDVVDRQWTIRGGLLPTILNKGRTTMKTGRAQPMGDREWFEKQKMNPKYLEELEKSNGELRVCQNGHEVPKTMSPCQTCKNWSWIKRDREERKAKSAAKVVG